MSLRKPQASSLEKSIPNEAEQAKINEVIKLLGVVATKFPGQCSDAAILRFLRARNWNTKKAARMFKENVKWRLLYKPDKIKWDDVAREAETGKIYRANYFDKYGRTVLVLRPGFQNTSSVEGQIKYLVYCMENAISNLDQGQEQMVWLIDFQRWNASCLSVKVTRETARILQDHYPERLGVALLYNPPKVFASFWPLVKPFLEHKTYKKVKFVYSDQPQSKKIMESLFEMDNLESAFGGKSNETFAYEAYANRMKYEERQKLDAKNSINATPSDQASVASDLYDSDLLASDISSEVSDEANSSRRYEMEGLDEMERHHVNSTGETEDKVDGGKRPDNGTELTLGNELEPWPMKVDSATASPSEE